MQIRIDNFGGLVLTKDPKKGPFWTALKAANCDVQSGSVDTTYNLDTATAAALTGSVGRKKIYNVSGTTFLEWSQDVNIAASPLADNSSKRIYYTGDGVPQVTDLAIATTGTAPYPVRSFVLGMPIPLGMQFATSSGGAAPLEDRGYLYTIVSPWGEESAPSLPTVVNGNSTGATVLLQGVGTVSRAFQAVPLMPTGITVNPVTFIGGTPSRLRFLIPTVAYRQDFHTGDRIWLQSTQPADNRMGEYLVSFVNYATGEVDVQCNIWENIIAGFHLWRVAPINNYNVVGVSINTPAVGKVTVRVDTTHGLRVGERVAISEVLGVTDINATFTVEAIGEDVENPNFVITKATAQVYTGRGICKRVEQHNTGEVRVSNVTFAAGIATVTVDSTAHIEVDDKVMIYGVLGAYQVNGIRQVLSVPSATTFTVALAAMGAYQDGGLVVREGPYPWTEITITNVTSAGGPFPNPFAITFTVSKAHDIVPGERILAYDIVGAVEANNFLTVSAVSATTVVAIAGQGVAAYVSGGNLVRCSSQMRKRIYRTNTGTQGAEYALVDEIPNERGHYSDTKDATALGVGLVSETWIQPPTDMHSIVAHPHGALVGASKNIVCITEPYQPHAWPLGYQVPLSSDVVGLGIVGTTVVAFTKDIPFNLTFSTPDNVTRARMDVGESCTSKRSITSTGLGVFYRGTSGMFLIGYQGSDNATKNFLPASSFSAASETVSTYWGNKIIWIENATQSGYIFDPVREDKGLTEFSVDYPIYDLHVSPVDGQLYASYLDGVTPKRAPLFKVVTNPARFDYYTQYIRIPKPVSFGALQVDWAWDTQSATMKDREAAIIRNLRRRAGRTAVVIDHALDDVVLGGDELETIYTPDTALTVPTERYMKVTVIANPDTADNQITVFDDFVVNDDPVRIDNGVLSDVWQVKLRGNGKVTAISLAEAIEELQGQ